VKHIQQLADWQKDKTFIYGGRTDLGNAKFNSGEVGLYTASSASYAGFKKTCQFEFGTAMLPYWPDQKGAPQNTSSAAQACGCSTVFKPEEYKGVAAFSNYISSPEVMADWHQFTGICPSPRRLTS